MPFYCYIVKCSDGTFYTGWTTDPLRREKQHNAGTGARYTRMRRPVKMVYIEEQPDRTTAMKREMAIKRLARSAKSKLIDSQQEKAS
jgi:putative endonuclease